MYRLRKTAPLRVQEVKGSETLKTQPIFKVNYFREATPMAILKVKRAFALLLITSVCTAAPPTTPKPSTIQIENALDKCLQITGQTVDITLIPTLKLDFKTLASTAECGCKSMLNSYSVAIKLDGYSRRVISGSFEFPNQSPLTLPLAAQPELIKGQSLHITLGCEVPL